MKKIKQRGLPIRAGKKRVNKAKKISRTAQTCKSPVILRDNFLYLGKIRVVLFFSKEGIHPGLFYLFGL